MFVSVFSHQDRFLYTEGKQNTAITTGDTNIPCNTKFTNIDKHVSL